MTRSRPPPRPRPAGDTRTLGSRHFGAIVGIGCGTGKNTALLAQLGDRVRALDFSTGMLARAKVQAANVTFAEADLTQPWPVADSSANLVVCNLVLEHIEDLHFILAEAGRVLTPGGRFFICELHPFPRSAGTVAKIPPRRRGRPDRRVCASYFRFSCCGCRKRLCIGKPPRMVAHGRSGKPPRLVSFVFEKTGATA